MDGYEIQERLKKLPVNISQISLLLTKTTTKIRFSDRDPIPKIYLPQLIELVALLEFWVSRNSKEE